MLFNIINSKNNFPVIEPLIINNKKIIFNSLYNPQKESERLVQSFDLDGVDVVIVLGTGLGYHIQSLMNEKKNFKLIVFECNESLSELFEVYRNTTCPEFKFRVFNTYNENEIFNILAESINEENLYKVKIFTYKPSLEIETEKYNSIIKSYKKFVRFLESNIQTEIMFGKLWKDNAVENLKYLNNAYDVLELKKQCAAKPVLIVSAGPSLDKQLNLLKKYQTNFFIFAVDTALKPLLENEIIPDYLGTVDPQYLNYLLVKGYKNDKISLITNLIVNPLILEQYKTNDKFFLNIESKFEKKLFSTTGFKNTFVKSGGSVATSLFTVAKIIGASPIIFIGQDLSYNSGKTHSELTAYKNRTVLNKFFSFETLFYSNLSDDTLIEKDIYGNSVFTSKTLKNYCEWFELEFAECSNKIINCTENGILKNNVEILSFETAIKKYCNLKLNKTKPVFSRHSFNEEKLKKCFF